MPTINSKVDGNKPNDSDKPKTKVEYVPSSFKFAESLIRTYSLVMSVEPTKDAKETAKAEMDKAERNVKKMTANGIDEEFIAPARKKFESAKNTYEAKTKELDKSSESIKTALATLDEAIKGIETLQSDMNAIVKALIEERDKATQPAKATKTAKNTAKKVSN